MKILIVSDAWHPQVNGVVRTYEYLAEELIRLGHDVRVIGPADFNLTLPLPGYSEIRLAIFPYLRMRQIIDDYAPDSIHIATEGPLGYAARRYCVRRKIGFTTSYHTQFPDYVAKRWARYLPFLYKPVHAIAKAAMRRFHRPSRAMMIATESLELELQGWNFKNKMCRFSRGVNLDLFRPASSAEDQTEFKDMPRPVALYVGRVAIEKNLEDFLSMEWSGSKVIIGDGPSQQELSQKYPDAIFAGRKQGEELASYYRSADVFAFPSRTDTFGIVLIEALASGLPVIGYTVTGPKDIVTQEALGALHESDLAEAAKALQSREDLSANWKQREIRADHVKTTYTWENAALQFLEAQSFADQSFTDQ